MSWPRRAEAIMLTEEICVGRPRRLNGSSLPQTLRILLVLLDEALLHLQHGRGYMLESHQLPERDARQR